MEERHATLHVLPSAAEPQQEWTAPRPAADRSHPVRVHVMADDPLTRIGIRTLLTGHPGIRVTGESAPGTRLADRRGALPDVLVARLPLTAEQEDLLAAETGDRTKVIVLGGTEPADAPACAHGRLPGTATAGQLASAVILASAGYAITPAGEVPAGAARRLSAVGPDALTDRECQVLELLAHGLSNEEIAESLTLSRHTVKTHVQNMLHKLRLRNRVHAAIYAFETGVRRPSG